MRWVYNEMIQSNQKICIISDRHKGIKMVFNRPHLGWFKQRGEAIHQYYMQQITKKNIQRRWKIGTKNKISNMILNVG
jgi:hypothetical protein